MSIEIKVPVLPESVSDAVIADWHKNKGDPIRRDENLVDLETDKVVLEVPAPCDGILLDIRAETGETVTTDTVLAIIEEATIDAQKAEAVAEKTPDARSVAPAMSADASPAAKKIAREKGVDVATISGSGRDGRIIKEDLSQAAAAAPPPVLAERQSGERTEERVPMSRMRARIAQRMVESQENAVMLTSFNEVDLSAVMEIRSRYKQAFLDEHGVKLGFMSFFVKACSAALRRYPVVNASMEGDDIVYHGFQDVGIAVATEKGLVVPILRNAASMSLADIELNIANYAHQARHGGLQLSDLQGGTFTITNGGVFGSLFSTPIINPPQSAILGMHAIKERAVVVDGQVVARPMMYIALTYDHKLINGKDAVLFLVAVKNSLEDPARMLLRL